MIHPQRILRRPGIVLVEALVAISTLAMGVIALGTITQNAIGTTVLAKDYLVARGLAKEGEEAVKSIRYTNWMLKPNPSDNKCWLTCVPSCDYCCNSATAATNKNYILFQSDGTWKMILESTNTDLNLNTVSTINEKYNLVKSADNSLYFSNFTQSGTPSKFYRSIKFTSVPVDNSSATFTVKVQWKDGAKTQEVNRTLTMYNYR